MGFLDDLFAESKYLNKDKQSTEENIADTNNSDKQPQSLYEYIKAAAEPFLEANKGMDFSLPPDISSPVPFADGAYDGVALYHMGASKMTDEAKELMIKAVQIASKGDIEAAERLFIDLGKVKRAIRFIDELQDYIIANRDNIPAGQLYKFAVYAATKSWDTECVKFGLSILELLNIEDNEEIRNVVTVLGLSEEFTLFSVFVMLRWQDGNEKIACLARMTHGWGRIHAIERLEADTDEIRRWLLREGVHNTVMPSYSALTCWNKSGAAEVLFGNAPLSDEDFHGIRDVIDALLDEGPCTGISGIENADDVLTEFLKKASGRELDIDDYEVVRNIRNYDEEDDNITALCSEILNSEKCRECVTLAVKDGKAIELANELGIDCKADVLRLLETDLEKHCYLCVHLMSDNEYRAKVIALFREKLPLDELKAAPAAELGLGREFKMQRCLDAIVQYLDGYPFEGTELIETALQCAPTRNRNIALKALRGWVNAKQTPLEKLLPEMFVLLKKLKDIEPDEKVREKMEKLLSGESDDK